jgi:Asp-tRNA(Asn)/Glu-tRNA(Gln) amidotransferase A subunit family amidase
LSAPASGKVSSEELLEVCLSRIDAHNETLNAIVTLDVERGRTRPGMPTRNARVGRNSARCTACRSP